MHGGAADRSGLIHVGDEIQEVNGFGVEGKTPNDVLKLLVILNILISASKDVSDFLTVLIFLFTQQSSEGTITFKIVPADSKTIFRESKVNIFCMSIHFI